MPAQLNARRGLKEISSLFLSRVPAPPESCNGGSRVPARVDSPPGALLSLTLAFEPEFPLPLCFSIGFCRWLLGVFPRLTLVATPPSRREWSLIADRFSLPSLERSPPAEPLGAYSLSESLCLILADVRAPEEGSPPLWGEEADCTAALPEATAAANPDRVIVRALTASPACGREAMAASDAWVAVLGARLDSFVRLYKELKKSGEASRECELFGFLARRGPKLSLEPIERAWSAAGGRLLSRPLSLLGQIDLGHLAEDSGGLGRRLALIEQSFACAPAIFAHAYMRARRRRNPARARFTEWVGRMENRAEGGPSPRPAAQPPIEIRA